MQTGGKGNLEHYRGEYLFFLYVLYESYKIPSLALILFSLWAAKIQNHKTNTMLPGQVLFLLSDNTVLVAVALSRLMSRSKTMLENKVELWHGLKMRKKLINEAAVLKCLYNLLILKYTDALKVVQCSLSPPPHIGKNLWVGIGLVNDLLNLR